MAMEPLERLTNFTIIRNIQFSRIENYGNQVNIPPWTAHITWGEIWLRFEIFNDGHLAGLALTTPLDGRNPSAPNPLGIPSRWDTITSNGLEWLRPAFDGDYQQLLLQYEAVPGNSLHIKALYQIKEYLAQTLTEPRKSIGQRTNPASFISFSPSEEIIHFVQLSEEDPERFQNGYTTSLSGETITPGNGIEPGLTPRLEMLFRVPVLDK